MATGQHNRKDRIYRRWELACSRQRRRSPLPPEQLAFLISLFSMSLLNSLDAELWEESSDPWFEIPNLQGTWVAAILLVIALLQTGHVGRFLRTKESRVGRFSASQVRRLRILLATLPVVGLCALLPWSEIFPSRSPRLDAVVAEKRPESTGRRWRTSHLFHSYRLAPRWSASTVSQVLLFILGVAAVELWLEWLKDEPPLCRLPQVLVGLFLFHGIGAAAMAYYLRERARHFPVTMPHSRLLPALAIFWLIPVPSFALGGLLLYFFFDAQGHRSNEDTLVGRGFGAHASGRRSPQWLVLEEELRSSWKDFPAYLRILRRPKTLDTSPELSKSTRNVLLLCRLKSFTLFFDATVVTRGALWIADLCSPWGSVVETSIVYAFGLSVILAIVGTIAVGINYAGLLARSPEAFWQLTSARLLAGSQLSFCAGLVLGAALHQGNVVRAGDALFAYGGIGFLLFGLSYPLADLLLGAPRQDNVETRQRLQWFVAFILLFGLGWRLKTTPEMEILAAIEQILWVAAALGFLPGKRLFIWLLRPRTTGDILSYSLSWRMRAEILFLAASALLPLGGLAVPAWLGLWQRSWQAVLHDLELGQPDSIVTDRGEN